MDDNIEEIEIGEAVVPYIKILISVGRENHDMLTIPEISLLLTQDGASPTENVKQLETKGNVFMISGCSDYQTSADAFINNKGTGAMTWSLLETLKQTPNCNWRELVKSMRNLLKTSQYDQIPQFSSGTFENIDTPIFI